MAALSAFGAFDNEPAEAQGVIIAETVAAALVGDEHASAAADLARPEAAGCALLAACCVLLVAVGLNRGRAVTISPVTVRPLRTTPLLAFFAARPAADPPSLVALSISRT
ncbi:MAG: hypothetical protein J0I18_04600 [Actinobacteria bacterium]|nr:hypothetical protein [Actinomycetota bacterium]